MFIKPGEKVVCVYNTYLDNLTYMKEYEVIKILDGVTYIYNDNNRYSGYHYGRFRSIKDIRRDKIMKIENSE